MKGKRRINGGRAPIRTVLYMEIMNAIQHNPVMEIFYQRLDAEGKHKKVELTACMRKASKDGGQKSYEGAITFK